MPAAVVPQGASTTAASSAALGSTQQASLPAPTAALALANHRIGGLLGRGGMGEVLLAHDDSIGRDVAVKRMCGATDPNGVARFLREARIQAQLEHPAIVPVHQIDHDALGRPFFTMKRVGGVTLAQVLTSEPTGARPRLLRAFVDVCKAVEFAHSRGIVHRDLKPANIMIGDFGEVYVLDWGIAKHLGESDLLVASERADDHSPITAAGTVLGTPAYMAPEQRSGAEVGLPSDVYALGAILFEISTGEAFHLQRPSSTTAPEIELLYRSALARDPGERPTVSALARAVESYLDGDRDVAHRRALAAGWLASARAALAADPVGRRAEAMRDAGRALALDPESPAAVDLVGRLMLVPGRFPSELAHELAGAESAAQQKQSRIATWAFAAIAVFFVLASWNGLRSASVVAMVSGLATVMGVAAYRMSRRPARRGELLVLALGNGLLAAMLSRAFGSLIIAPAATCVMAVSLTSYPQLIDRARWVIALLIASWIAPVVLEQVGILARTWSVVGDQIVSRSTMIRIGGSTAELLIAANVIAIAVIGLFANAVARSRRDAQRQLAVQAWHLRQLLPQ